MLRTHLLAGALLVSSLILAGSIWYGSNEVAAELELSRRENNRLAQEGLNFEHSKVRVERVKNLALTCAYFTAMEQNEDYLLAMLEVNEGLMSQDHLFTWIALTGAKDPDAKMQLTDERVVLAIKDRCYHAWYSGSDFDDVRQYMREH